MSFYWFSDT